MRDWGQCMGQGRGIEPQGSLRVLLAISLLLKLMFGYPEPVRIRVRVRVGQGRV